MTLLRKRLCPVGRFAPSRTSSAASSEQARSGSLVVLWRWGRVELPVQGLLADRVYERSRRFWISRNEARTDTLLALARPVHLWPAYRPIGGPQLR